MVIRVEPQILLVREDMGEHWWPQVARKASNDAAPQRARRHHTSAKLRTWCGRVGIGLGRQIASEWGVRLDERKHSRGFVDEALPQRVLDLMPARRRKRSN